MNTWQKGKLNKFKLKEKDITVVKMPYITIHGKPVHNEHAEFKHYTCDCGNLELFGFIEKFGGKCRDCMNFNKK